MCVKLKPVVREYFLMQYLYPLGNNLKLSVLSNDAWFCFRYCTVTSCNLRPYLYSRALEILYRYYFPHYNPWGTISRKGFVLWFEETSNLHLISVTIFPLHFSVLTQNTYWQPPGRYVTTINQSFEPNWKSSISLKHQSKYCPPESQRQGPFPGCNSSIMHTTWENSSRGKPGHLVLRSLLLTLLKGYKSRLLTPLLVLSKGINAAGNVQSDRKKDGNIFWCASMKEQSFLIQFLFTRLNQRCCESGKQKHPWKLITLKLNAWKFSFRKVLVQSEIWAISLLLSCHSKWIRWMCGGELIEYCLCLEAWTNKGQT